MQGKGDLEDLLRQREKIDERLDGFKKPLAVMFADIKGSTDYFDRWGDVEGRLMVQRCENVMLPVLEDYGAGIKRLGDGVMAYFAETEDAVKAAIAIQRGIQDYNRSKEDRLQVHLRIGINSGRAIVEEDDISGDVVNVASRVESLAPIDGIAVSKSVYDEIRQADDIICRFLGERNVKGKTEPIRVYEVVWAEEEMTAGALRGPEPDGSPVPGEEQCFYLEIFLEGAKLRVKSHEGARGAENTLTFYEEADVALARVEEYASRIKNLLERANRSGRLSGEILTDLKQAGRDLYGKLLPAGTRERLDGTRVTTLVLKLDEGLVHIPWELLYDGRDFFCRRFSMGRVVSTRQDFSAGQREVRLPLRMLLLADPQGNLPSSHDEGIRVKEMLDGAEETIHVSLRSSNISRDFVRSKLKFFDIVHYAGHADYTAADPAESGFLLGDGKLSAREIRGMVDPMPFPSLVVSNACRSGETEEWKVGGGYEQVYGLANAFLFSGVRHYLGTFWEVQDEPSLYFSLSFYEALAAGVPVGEAVRRARNTLMEKYGEQAIFWASYLLYGDPTYRYVRDNALGGGRERDDARAGKTTEPAAQLRASGDEGTIPAERKRRRLLGVLFAVLVLTALFVGISFLRDGERPRPGTAGEERSLSTSAVDRVAREKRADRIDALVRDLSAAYRSGSVPARVTDDPWTSSPVGVVVLGVKGVGIDDVEREFVLARLITALGNNRRIRVVERDLLDKLLEELKLTSSDLADRSTALRLGRLLSARVIITGGLVKDRNDWMVNLRLIETETSIIKGSLVETLPGVEAADVARFAAEAVVKDLTRWYPIKGRIVSVENSAVTLNIGSDIGLTKGARLSVLGDDMTPVAEIEAVDVTSGGATGRLAAGTGVRAGQRVVVIRAAGAGLPRPVSQERAE